MAVARDDLGRAARRYRGPDNNYPPFWNKVYDELIITSEAE